MSEQKWPEAVANAVWGILALYALWMASWDARCIAIALLIKLTGLRNAMKEHK